jgi:class 3 adenylate cyclase
MADERGVERRLAAILAADAVGYSRLMEADEAGAHARLKAVRKGFIEPRIAEHAAVSSSSQETARSWNSRA